MTVVFFVRIGSSGAAGMSAKGGSVSKSVGDCSRSFLGSNGEPDLEDTAGMGRGRLLEEETCRGDE